MIASKSSDRSQQVNWYVRKNTDVTLTLTFTSSGAYDIAALTFLPRVYNLSGITILTPSQVNGGANGILTLSLTNTQTNITADEYWWRLDITDPYDYAIINGTFQINDFVWDSGNENNTGSISVDINGTAVTISIVNT